MTYSHNKLFDDTQLDVLGVISDSHHVLPVDESGTSSDPTVWAFPWDLRPRLRPGCLLRLDELQAYATAHHTTVDVLVATPGIQAVDANTYIITEAAVPA